MKKLNPDVIASIRELSVQGLGPVEISKRLTIDRGTVRRYASTATATREAFNPTELKTLLKTASNVVYKPAQAPEIFIPTYKPRTHCIIPDTQVKPGVPTDHLRWIGNYIAEKQPEVVIQIGDFNDMPSLSSYSLGKAEAEGARYVDDIEAGQEAMKVLCSPFANIEDYKPRMVLTLGNHEDRIDREASANPRFEGAISTEQLGYEVFGWEVHPFLEVVNIDGWEYSHFFTSGVMGRPVSSAQALLRERQCSAVMGHVQHTDVAFHKKTGKIGIFCGICYLHDEKYLTPQGNTTRRQIIFLHEVNDGYGDPMFVSLAFLKAKYS